MRAWPIVAVSVALASTPAPAEAKEIGLVSLVQARCDSITIDIQLDTSWKPSPNPNNATYKVYRMKGSQENALMASSNDTTIEMKDLQESTSYNMYANARSRHKNGRGIPIYRKVGELKVVTLPCSVVNEFTPVPGDVRLRHELTGKCLFGNPVEGGPVKTWGCWKDPQMAISLEKLAGQELRIRVRAKGKCLFGNPVEGREVKNWTCWDDPNMVYVRENLDNNRVRLRHKLTGQCMYGDPNDGGPVKNWPCWNDPNMVWVIDPF